MIYERLLMRVASDVLEVGHKRNIKRHYICYYMRRRYFQRSHVRLHLQTSSLHQSFLCVVSNSPLRPAVALAVYCGGRKLESTALVAILGLANCFTKLTCGLTWDVFVLSWLLRLTWH